MQFSKHPIRNLSNKPWFWGLPFGQADLTQNSEIVQIQFGLNKKFPPLLAGIS